MTGPSPSFDPPERLTARHDLSAFDCGDADLNAWLRRRALGNEPEGASRTYVVRQGERVVAFYALAVGAVEARRAPGRVRRNMPNPIPVMLLGRLAVDRTCHGRGVGRGLVRDAVLRTVRAADIAGIRALLVHAKAPEVAAFYRALGFVASPIDPLTLMIRIKDARAAIDTD